MSSYVRREALDQVKQELSVQTEARRSAEEDRDALRDVLEATREREATLSGALDQVTQERDAALARLAEETADTAAQATGEGASDLQADPA